MRLLLTIPGLRWLLLRLAERSFRKTIERAFREKRDLGATANEWAVRRKAWLYGVKWVRTEDTICGTFAINELRLVLHGEML